MHALRAELLIGHDSGLAVLAATLGFRRPCSNPTVAGLPAAQQAVLALRVN